VGRASDELSISSEVAWECIAIKKCRWYIKIKGDKWNRVVRGVSKSACQSEGPVGRIGCTCVGVPVRVRFLTVTAEWQSCCDVKVCLFADKEFRWDEVRRRFHVGGSDHFEGVIGLKNFLRFLCNCVCHLEWVKNLECAMDGEFVLLTGRRVRAKVSSTVVEVSVGCGS